MKSLAAAAARAQSSSSFGLSVTFPVPEHVWHFRDQRQEGQGSRSFFWRQ
jgi:hypothetical protein